MARRSPLGIEVSPPNWREEAEKLVLREDKVLRNDPMILQEAVRILKTEEAEKALRHLTYAARRSKRDEGWPHFELAGRIILCAQISVALSRAKGKGIKTTNCRKRVREYSFKITKAIRTIQEHKPTLFAGNENSMATILLFHDCIVEVTAPQPGRPKQSPANLLILLLSHSFSRRYETPIHGATAALLNTTFPGQKWTARNVAAKHATSTYKIPP